jgi:hypothetical protein
MECEYKAIWLGLVAICFCVFVSFLFSLFGLLSAPSVIFVSLTFGYQREATSYQVVLTYRVWMV